MNEWIDDNLSDAFGRRPGRKGNNLSGTGGYEQDATAAATMAAGKKSGPCPVHGGMLSSPAYERAMDPGYVYETGQPT